MPTKEEKYAEAYRRGILPEDKKARYVEAVRRGLIKNPDLLAELQGADLPDIELPQEITDSPFTAGIKEAGRAAITGVTNAADVLPEIGDAVTSAAAWAAGKIGIGDGTYTPAARFKNMLPESARPKSEGGKFIADVIPYFVAPEAKAAEAPRLASKIARLGQRFSGGVKQNLVGSLAQSDATGQDFAGTLAGNIAMGEGLRGLGKGAKWGYGKLIGNADLAEIAAIETALAQGTQTGAQRPPEQVLKNIGKATKGKAGGSDAEALAYAINPSKDVLEAADRLGMENTLLPSHFSTNPAYQAIEQGLKSIPGSILDAHEKKAIGLLANKTDDLINDYGGTIDKAELSGRFKDRSLEQIRALEEKSNKLYHEVEKKISPGQIVGTENTLKHLIEKAETYGGEEYLSAAEQKVLKQMDDKSLPTYARLNAVRQQVGAAISKKEGPFKDVASGELKQLYAKLAEDQQQAANFHGIGDVYTMAKDLVVQRKALEGDLVGLLGKDMSGALSTRAGQGIKGLSTGNYKVFDQMMDKVPADMREELTLTALNDAFTMGSRKEKQLNIPGFVDWYQGLMRNPGARARLENNLPAEASKRLRDIYEVANGIRVAKSNEISTGRIQSLIDKFDKDDGMLAKLFGPAGKVAGVGAVGATGGPVAAAVTSTAIGLLGRAKDKRSVLADRLLSSNQFKSFTKQIAGSGANTAAQKARLDKLMQRSELYQKWFATLSRKEQQAIARVGITDWLGGEDKQ